MIASPVACNTNTRKYSQYTLHDLAEAARARGGRGAAGIESSIQDCKKGKNVAFAWVNYPSAQGAAKVHAVGFNYVAMSSR